MSLHFLGIRDFPSLHRELTSSQLPTIIPEDSTEELAQDSKDVLVQRLLDLASQIQEQDLPDQALSTLHHDVDHMERTWQKTPAPKPPLVRPMLRSFGSSMSLRSNGSHQDEPFWRPGSPLSSGLESPFRFHSPKATISKAPETAKPAPSAMRCAILANEADVLLAKLVKVVTELKSRREESEVRTNRNPSRSSCIFCISALSTPTDVSQHIHDLLITRAEKAAQRVTELEDKIADLEGDYGETQSEMHYLRLQMRAIEVQALEHIESSPDEELTQSIRNWKQQWAEIDQSIKDKRKKCVVETPKKEMPRRIINVG